MARVAESRLGLVPVGAAAGMRRRSVAPCLSALLMSALLASVGAPAMAARPVNVAVAKPKPRLTLDAGPSFPSPVTDPTTFSFTASGGSAANARLQSVERAFRFTPSGQSDDRKALSLSMSARVVAATGDRTRTVAEPARTVPAAYNVDLAVGWKGFAVNTGFSHTEPAGVGVGGFAAAAGAPLLARPTDAVNLGLSYGGRNWRTRVQGTAEQGGPLLFAPLERRYSLEVGGAYLLAPRLSVTGGVRYRLPPMSPSLLDGDRADQSVYLGTNIAF